MQREVSGGQEALTVDAAEIVAVNGPARELARSSSTAFVPGIAEPPMSVAEFTGEEPRPVAAMAAAPHVRLPNGVEFDLGQAGMRELAAVVHMLGGAAVLRFDEGLKVYLHRDPVDFRLGINELSILVEQAMRVSPMSSALFVFGNRRRDQIKILGWQGNGFWLFLKRLEADPLRLAERSGDGGLERGAIALAARWHRPGGCPQAPAALLRAGWLNVLRRQRSNHDAAVAPDHQVAHRTVPGAVRRA